MQDLFLRQRNAITYTVALMPDYLISNVNWLLRNHSMKPIELSRRSRVPQPTITRLLSGEAKTPKRGTLQKIAGCFGVAVDDLIDVDLRKVGDARRDIPRNVPLLTPAALDQWLQAATRGADGILAYGLSPKGFAMACPDTLSSRCTAQDFLLFDPLAESGDVALIRRRGLLAVRDVQRELDLIVFVGGSFPIPASECDLIIFAVAVAQRPV